MMMMMTMVGSTRTKEMMSMLELYIDESLIGDHDVYPNSAEAKAKDFESLPLNIDFNHRQSKPKIKSSEAVEASKSVDLEKKAEDKGNAVVIPDSLMKRKITIYMLPSKSITMGSPIQVALAPSNINPNQSPVNPADVAFTTTTGEKRDADSAIPSNKLSAMVAVGVELVTLQLKKL
ncbi:hypothetical protein NE237_022492 [Protea cynaroides]|uniref:Uncharacterized protein n=1 Tax=Protea cynaroides TaxID=273540 RepID=A0A9Q0K5V9_9MAGN|nr:hypothetical protein NE237_022492 [Protea cynaroides]